MTAVSGQARSVDKMVLSVEQAEGRGARVRRSIGRSELSTLDPFLLLDHFNVKPPGGFPDHPHRGFETVTYMINGSFTHEDFTKHKGIIGPGDLQWMTAGRGVLHSEIPGPEGGEGLQLWVNLAAKDKMVPADYQELRKPSIPVAKQNGVTATVIAGECLGIKSPVRTRTPTMYLDITLEPGAKFSQPVPSVWTAFVYIWSGKFTFGPEGDQKTKEAFYTVTFKKNGDSIFMANSLEDGPSRLILIAGQPLNEPIARHGPFVMNTQEEISQAIRDYQAGENGFENAHSWQSEHTRKQSFSKH